MVTQVRGSACVAASLFLALAASCSGSSHLGSETATDGGPLVDTTTEAPTNLADGAFDGGIDATVDGSIEATVEGGIDATVDATVPSGCLGATLGPAGGRFVHPGGASLIVPPGALATSILLTLCPATAPSNATLGAAPLGGGWQAGPEGQAFSQPVELVLPFDPTRIPPGADVSAVQVRSAPASGASFTALQSTVDLTERIVHTRTTHFSQFVPSQSATPIFITTAPSLPSGTVQVAYSEQFAASGGTAPYTWTVPSTSALPPGLSLSSAGLLGGTPSIPGHFAFFIAVADTASGAVELAVSLTINPPNNPIPTLTQVAPSSIAQGSGDTVVTLSGTGFVPTTQVLWDGASLPTTFVGSTDVAATVPAADLLNSGAHQISAINPTPGGGTSASVTFTVTPAALNPVPSIVSVTPTSLPVSSIDVQVAITGSNFIAASSAVIGPQGIATSFVSATQLLAAVPAAFLSNAGTLSLGVFNPAPGGGFGATTATLTVGTLNPVPVLTSLAPSSVNAGSGAFTLTASGSGFFTGAQAFFGNTSLATTLVSATTLNVNVPGYLVANSGSASIVVVNPMPGGGASAPLTFTIAMQGQDAAVDAATDAGANGNGGTLTVLATGQSYPEGIVVDSTNAYWVNEGRWDPDAGSFAANTGSVMMVPIAGGTPTTLVSAQCVPDKIAVDSAYVYWANTRGETPEGGLDPAGGTIMKVPIDGGAPTTVASGQVQPFGIAVDATNVYWVVTNSGSQVMRVPKTGGTPTVLGTTSLGALDLTVDGTNVYWTTGGTVMSTPLDAGSSVVLSTGAGQANGIVVYGTNVYWTQDDGVALVGSVLKVPIGGGSVTTLFSGQYGPWGIAIDSTNVYWNMASGNGNGAVMTVPSMGGTPTTLASRLNNPEWGIAVDGTSVYWTNNADGTVMKRTPK